MSECWIKPNRRALWVGMIVPALLFAGATVLALSTPNRGWWLAVGASGWLVAAVTGVVMGLLGLLIRTPRVAYQDGQLLVYLRSIWPERVPVEHVECFFRGQGTSDIPVDLKTDPQTSTIVIRLSESATAFHQSETKAALGLWCGGYIVLRGTWCEPITARLLLQLNQRLVHVQRSRRQTGMEQVSLAPALESPTGPQLTNQESS